MDSSWIGSHQSDYNTNQGFPTLGWRLGKLTKNLGFLRILKDQGYLKGGRYEKFLREVLFDTLTSLRSESIIIVVGDIDDNKNKIYLVLSTLYKMIF